MLRAAFNVSWRDHLTNEQLYGGYSETDGEDIRTRRFQLAGHRFRHPELPTHDVLLWKTQGRRSRRRSAATFTTNLLKDMQVESVEELQQLLGDRNSWRIISGLRPSEWVSEIIFTNRFIATSICRILYLPHSTEKLWVFSKRDFKWKIKIKYRGVRYFVITAW